jgi:hypothetical protein
LTPNDLIQKALQRITVLSEGETMSSKQAADGLDTLNSLVDAWAADRLMIYQQTRTQFTIVANTATYTVGSGGDVNIVRPVYVDHINYIVDTTVTPNLEIQMQPLTDDAWAKVPIKDLTSVYPTCWYWNPTFDTSRATLTLWPVPTASNLGGAIYYQGPAIAEFASLDTVILMPPGYRRMMITNLAAELVSEYGINPQTVPTLLQQASVSLATVKRANIELMDLSLDAAALVQGRDRSFFYNIYSGP